MKRPFAGARLDRHALKGLLRRIDRAAGDLNVLLVVIVIGLAALDITFLVTQKVVDRLPPMIRMTHDTPPSLSP